jgi:uncharacterized protein (TIGR03546 family)
MLDVNLSAVLLAITLCSLVAYIFDPFFHWLGYMLLVNVDGLRGMWTWMYNAPIAPLTRFNNTVVMGSLSTALVLFVPTYLGMQRLILAYRSHIGAKVEKWRLFQIIKRSSLVRWYGKLRDMGS